MTTPPRAVTLFTILVQVQIGFLGTGGSVKTTSVNRVLAVWFHDVDEYDCDADVDLI